MRTEIADSGHGVEIADQPAGNRSGKTIRRGRQVTRAVSAVAVPGDRQTVPVDKSLGDKRVDRLEEVGLVGGTPGAVDGVHEVCAVPVRPTWIEGQDAPTLGGENLVGGVIGICNAGPRVVRSAVNVEQKGCSATGFGSGQQPTMHGAAVGDGELAFFGGKQCHLGECFCGEFRQRGDRAAVEIDECDLAEGLLRGDDDGGDAGVTGNGERRDDLVGIGDEGSRGAGFDVGRVQMRPSTIA